MAPELAPIIELRSWYEGNSLKHKDLARSLNLSPQQLANLFSGRNQPTGKQLLTVLQFLRTNMTTEPIKTLAAAKEKIEALTAELARRAPAKITAPVGAFAPPASAATWMPPVVAKTATPPLTAWENEVARAHTARTANLSSLPIELQSADQLRSMLAVEKDASKRFAIYEQIKSLGGPKADSAQAPAFDTEKDLKNFKSMEVATVPPPKRLPESANTPVKIQAILDVTVLDPDLLSMLGNPVHTPLQRGTIYDEVKKRRALAEGPLV